MGTTEVVPILLRIKCYEPNLVVHTVHEGAEFA